MKTIEQIKKGCGKRIITPDMILGCGDISFANEILYCPTCQAQLTQAEEFLKLIENLNIRFRKENIPQRLSGDEFNDLWEEELKQATKGKEKE